MNGKKIIFEIYFKNNNVDVLGTGIYMFYDNGKKAKNDKTKTLFL